MEEKVELGIGFVTGRDNVCEIINNYYKEILEQIKKYRCQVNLTFFILYDLSYQDTPRESFYQINSEVYNNVKVQYITPEDIEKEKKNLYKKYHILARETDLLLGYGHAKGRNTIMYFALKNKIDYLLFWDDDEYPVACLKEGEKVEWRKQNNVLRHLQEIENVDITIGYHCGYISPIPYIELEKEEETEVFKNFIEAVSNEIVEWDKIKQLMEEDNGVTYAQKEIAEGNGKYFLEKQNGTKWVAGSTLCVNLNRVTRIPAFYNPPYARGEDTFFSLNLDDCAVMKIPVYHFHDGFLKYPEIMNEKYPRTLERMNFHGDIKIEDRFLNASLGWLKYKPLLLYIQHKEQYNQKIKEMREHLEVSIPKLTKIFNNNAFYQLIDVLDKYDASVQKDYELYLKTNEIWNQLKKNVIE